MHERDRAEAAGMAQMTGCGLMPPCALIIVCLMNSACAAPAVNVPSVAINGPTATLTAADQTSDNTDLIQGLLDNADITEIIVEPGARNAPWLVRPLFFRHDNTTIHLNAGAILEAARKGFPELGDCLLRAERLKNIAVTGDAGATLRMHKEEYARLPASEYQHALSLLACENVTISNLRIENTGGDGIYLGDPDDNSGYCSHVAITDVVTDGCGRNGLSVISVDGLTVTDCIFANTRGKGRVAAAGPWAGVDIEPNSSGQRLRDIAFDGCAMRGNYGGGFVISTANLAGSADAISITVSNCAMEANRGAGISITKVPGTLSADSLITFENCDILNNREIGVFVAGKARAAGMLSFVNCRVKIANGNKEKAAFSIYSFTETTETGGNILLDQVTILPAGKKWPRRVPYCLSIDGTYCLIDGVSGEVYAGGGTLNVEDAANIAVSVLPAY